MAAGDVLGPDVGVLAARSIAAAEDYLAAGELRGVRLGVITFASVEVERARELCRRIRASSPQALLLASPADDAADSKLVASVGADDALPAAQLSAVVVRLLARAVLHRDAKEGGLSSLREQAEYERFQSIAQMVGGLAHEISTPIGVASTASSILVRLLPLVSDPSHKGADHAEIVKDFNEAMASLKRNVARATQLIKGFKQLTSSQVSGQRGKVGLAALIDDCVLSMAPELRKRAITVKVEGPDLKWDGYPGELSQVVINLVQNTIRYGYPEERDGKVEVRLAAVDRGGEERYRIEYQDFGRGIAPEVRSRLFQRFVTTGKEQGGTGLGLALSRDIVTELLHGSLTCESEVGRGATFVIELPRRSPNQVAVPPDPPAPTEPERLIELLLGAIPERRNDPRFEVNAPLAVQSLIRILHGATSGASKDAPTGAGGPSSATFVNVSRHGARFLTKESPGGIGEVIELAIPCPGEREIRLAAQIVRVEEASTGYDVAVRFISRGPAA